MKIVNYKFHFNENDNSYIYMNLENNYKFKITLESFYLEVFEYNHKLRDYCDKFNDYESFTEELIELNYSFIDDLEKYISKFDEIQIKVFSLYV